MKNLKYKMINFFRFLKELGQSDIRLCKSRKKF